MQVLEKKHIFDTLRIFITYIMSGSTTIDKGYPAMPNALVTAADEVRNKFHTIFTGRNITDERINALVTAVFNSINSPLEGFPETTPPQKLENQLRDFLIAFDVISANERNSDAVDQFIKAIIDAVTKGTSKIMQN